MDKKLEIRRSGGRDPEGVPTWRYNIVDVEKRPHKYIESTETSVLDKHYLLYHIIKIAGPPYEKNLFGVVDISEPVEADRRLYQKIRNLAEEIAVVRGHWTIDEKMEDEATYRSLEPFLKDVFHKRESLTQNECRYNLKDSQENRPEQSGHTYKAD